MRKDCDRCRIVGQVCRKNGANTRIEPSIVISSLNLEYLYLLKSERIRGLTIIEGTFTFMLPRAPEKLYTIPSCLLVTI